MLPKMGCGATTQQCTAVYSLTGCAKYNELLHWTIVSAHRRLSLPTDQKQPVTRACTTCVQRERGHPGVIYTINLPAVNSDCWHISTL